MKFYITFLLSGCITHFFSEKKFSTRFEKDNLFRFLDDETQLGRVVTNEGIKICTEVF